MVVGLSVFVRKVVAVAVVVGVIVVDGILVAVVCVVLVVGLLVVVVVVGLTVNRSLPCERERLDATTTARSTSHRDQRQLCKALLGICSLASHSLYSSWASQN